MIDIHLLLEATKKASIDTSNAGIEGIVAWVIHHITILDEGMKLILTTILVLSALLRLSIGIMKFYYTIKNKGVDGD